MTAVTSLMSHDHVMSSTHFVKRSYSSYVIQQSTRGRTMADPVDKFILLPRACVFLCEGYERRLSTSSCTLPLCTCSCKTYVRHPFHLHQRLLWFLYDALHSLNTHLLGHLSRSVFNGRGRRLARLLRFLSKLRRKQTSSRTDRHTDVLLDILTRSVRWV